MQGTIVQSLGLTMAGNAFLQGRDLGHFWPDSIIFTFCRTVRFIIRNGATETEAGEDPMAWLESLKGDCHGFSLRVVARNRPGISDLMGTALVGHGSRWLIEAMGQSHASQWEDEWQFDEQGEDPGWRVVYVGTPLSPSASPPERPDLDSIEKGLRHALEAIAPFADTAAPYWSSFFRDALRELDNLGMVEKSGDFPLPGLLSRHAFRILAACRAAWVFGGMGAWNDGAYGDEHAAEGDRLTEALFDTLQRSLVGVANSTIPDAGSD